MRKTTTKKLGDTSLLQGQGNTFVIIECKPDKKFKYSYLMSPISSGSEVNRKSKTNRRALEIEYLSTRTILDNLKLSNLDIKARVLTSDGGTRTCALNGIFNLLNKEEKTTYSFSAFGIVRDMLVYDLNYLQDSESMVDVPVGFKIVDNEVVEYCYLQLDGEISLDNLVKGLEELQLKIPK